ncbi:PREDICTED: phosphate carrier protein, mitochondrial [Vollenhovia emeryi]|uniref:phosphate carrier protein, mitochondrial n=1 Tax=Vollenhovia emeryi TaxID=411798 RepID=UPI0005F4C39A|nr:PREDICTED: phosphate carrier protein, mitochondrial [Vollenhovia emeryi]
MRSLCSRLYGSASAIALVARGFPAAATVYLCHSSAGFRVTRVVCHSRCERESRGNATMLSWMQEAAKMNPFSSPFTTVKCQALENDARPLVPSRNIVAASVEEGDSCEFGSNHYFLLCGLGGILSCGLTHTGITPLDLVKCRIQVDPQKYKSVFSGFRVTLAEDGTRGLVRGWAPTFFGYSIQGMFKFGLYEVFKVYYSALAGEELSYEYRTSLYLISSASAEFFADIGLAPFEAAKVKIQTMPGYANTLRQAMPKMYADEGLSGFYKGLVPLWLRQIPYTMMKFACFERTVELLYKHVVPRPRAECSKSEQLVVTFAAGYIAGVFCAIVSHPADTVVSKLNQEKGSSAGEVLKKLGMGGVWKGLGPRIVMIGTLTAAQWFIYDAVKVWLRMPRPPPPEMPESLKKKYGVA